MEMSRVGGRRSRTGKRGKRTSKSRRVNQVDRSRNDKYGRCGGVGEGVGG